MKTEKDELSGKAFRPSSARLRATSFKLRSARYSPDKITEAELGETKTRALGPQSTLAAFWKYACPELLSRTVCAWDLLVGAKLTAVIRIIAIIVFIKTVIAPHNRRTLPCPLAQHGFLLFFFG